jgi:bifunctional oligoribonuclease and PAP phosphatase NrnA
LAVHNGGRTADFSPYQVESFVNPVPGLLIEKLSETSRVVLAGHINPDVDALGAMLGLARALPAREVTFSTGGQSVQNRLAFMLELGECRPAQSDDIARAETVVVVDTANVRRVGIEGGWGAISDKCVINIDHHITNEDFGQVNWVVGHRASTSEMVYELIRTAGWSIDSKTATLLLAGIHSDTCGFTLPTVAAETFETAASLLRAGANLPRIGEQLFRSQSQHEFDLIRAVYRNTRLACDGLVAYSTLSLAEIRAAGCTPADIDDQVSIPRSLSGVRMAILLSEIEPGVIRINLRGEDMTPVLPVAASLGGGGHTYAAGVRVRGSMNDALQRILTTATDCLRHFPAL